MFFTQDSVSSILLKDKEYNIKSIPFFGTEKDWKKNGTYVPKEGEIIIYIPENKLVDNTYRIKFGDGINTVDSLEFIYINSSEDIESLIELITNNAQAISLLENRINNLTAIDIGADEFGAASAALDSAKKYTDQEVAKASGGLSEEQIQSMIDISQGVHIANKNNPHEVTAAQVGAAPSLHNHDDRYYGKEALDNKKNEIIQSSQDYTNTKILEQVGDKTVAEQIFLAIEDLEHPVYVDEDGTDSSAEIINADTLGGRPASEYATQTFVTNKITEAQLSGGSGSGDIDLSGYATQDDVSALSNLIGDTKVSTQISNAINAIDYPVNSVNGKTGNVQLTASDVGARSSDWTPTAEDVGARPNTWMPSASGVGAAPAGYGLGSTPKDIKGSELNDTTRNGWYRIAGDSLAIGGTTFTDAFVHVKKYSNSYLVQEVYPMSARCKIVRWCTNGTWYEEWENPPKSKGFEYRTTERWLNLPVFVRTFEVTMSNGGTITVDDGYRIIRVEGFVQSRGTLPIIINNGSLSDAYSAYLKAESNKITMYCGSSMSKTAWITAYYVKS